MAIQFHCPGCSQPIEVDDTYAGQTAACPYCRRVVNVPIESTLERDAPIVARPTVPGEGRDAAAPGFSDTSAPGTTPGAPPPSPESLYVGPAQTYRAQVARTYGNYALICTALVVLLFGCVVIYAITQMAPELMKSPGSQPSPARMAEIEAKLHANLWMGAVQIGATFFALVGLALGIISLVQSRYNNWRAIVSVVICGLSVLCLCAGTVMAVLASGLGAPA